MSSMSIDGHFNCSLILKEFGRSRVTIEMLPDVALLRLFDFYLDEDQIDAWYTLVHVCQNWRDVVFSSPRRLKVRLPCTPATPLREMLDVWPPLPIVIFGHVDDTMGEDNIIAALEHHNRVCELWLFEIPSPKLEKVLGALQRPFPELTHLQFGTIGKTTHVFPTTFLGGHVPRLQTLLLYRVPFPGLPKLLLSATHLVRLHLRRIPDSGYISPEAMATGLSVLTRLESLVIKFESPGRLPDWKSRSPPPQTRTLLPVLTQLRLKGADEYMEDLVAQIDTPLLDKLAITFFQRLTFHNNPQITQFISRTPKFVAHNKAQVHFYDRDVWATLSQTSDGEFKLGMSCSPSDQRLSSLAQLCSSSFPQAHISAVEHLYIDGCQRLWRNDIDNSQWLEFLRLFIAVKCLYISQGFVTRVAPALQDLVGERVTEVLPVLQTIFLEETPPPIPVQEFVGRFVAARQQTGHPIAVFRWERVENS